MDAGLLNVLHDRTDHHLLTIAHQVDVDLDGGIKEIIQQYRAVPGDLHCIAHIAP